MLALLAPMRFFLRLPHCRTACWGLGARLAALLVGVAVLLAPLAPRETCAQSTQGPEDETKAVVVEGRDARARVAFYRDDVVRVDWRSRASGGFDGAPDTSLAVVRMPGEAARRHDVQQRARSGSGSGSGGGRVLRTESLTVQVDADPLRLRFFDGQGKPLTRGAPESSFTTPGDTAQALRFAIGPETRFYGTGERSDGHAEAGEESLDLRGRAFRSYNTQQYGYVEAPSVMKINVPLLTTTGGYALFVDSPWPGRFDVGAERTNRLQYTAVNGGDPAHGSLTYYLIAGDGPTEQLEGYTWLTGRQPMPPRWSLGFVQSQYGYRSAEAARAVVDTFQQKNIPLSALVLDLYWFDRMGDLAWGQKSGNWPDPAALAEDLEDDGIKLINITEPYLVTASRLFDEAAAEGYLGTRPGSNEPYVMDDWWSCTAGAAFATEAAKDDGACRVALLDITDPEAQDWWWNQYPEFMDVGVDGFWTDLGEPERHPTDMQHAMGATARVHNVYNLLWAKTLYEGFRKRRPNRRMFNLTRSGYAGIQRYGTALWSGDVARRFVTLEEQIPLMLNAGLSGLGYYSSDLGGFTGDKRSAELYARWVTMGTFTPTMRVHGQDDLPTEPWGFGEEAEQIVTDYIRLRYRMLPYNYALARENHETGTPLARPVFSAEGSRGEEAPRGDAFTWGDALLVAPVTEEGKRERSVRLPRGPAWTNYWTGERVDGGKTIQAAAPLARVPLFARAGSIIPMRASARPTTVPFDTLRLDVFPHESQPARFTLYEDDGATQSYRRGAYAKTRLVQRWRAGEQGGQDSGDARTLRLEIGPAVGGYDGLPAERLWRADVRHVAEAPSDVRSDGHALRERPSREALYAAPEGGYFYDAETQRLVVQAPPGAATDRAHWLTARGVRLAR